MKTAVIIVTWNSINDIPHCLNSLAKQDTTEFKTVVVDNASIDGTADFIEQHFPHVTLLRSEKNRHFTGGNNMGIEFARGEWNPEFIVILNPDTVVAENWLSAQLKIMEHKPEVGIVGPKIIFAPGFSPEGSIATNERQVINSAGIHPGGFLFPYDIGFGEVDKGQYDQAHEAYAVTGTSIMIRSTVFERIGLLFEPFKAYLEEVDFCVRASKAGFKVIFTPTTHVLHRHMQSSNKTSGYYDFLSRRNYLLLVWRHYSWKKFLRAVFQNLKEIPLTQFFRTLFAFMAMQKQ